MRLSGTVLALLLAAGCQGTPDSTTASDADGDDHVDARPALLAELGAPDAFSITVDEVDGTVTRFESWSWSDELVQVDMVDGEVVWAVALDPLPEPAILPLAYDPTEFEMLVPIDDVRALLAGVELLEVDAADDVNDDDLPEPQAPCPLLGDRPVDDVAGAPSDVEEPWDPEAGLVQILSDGLYPGRFELDDGNPTFGHEVLRAEVRMEVVGGVYTLHVDVEFTMRGPGSPPCHNTHRITYTGVSDDDDRRGIPAEFRGPSSHTVTDPGCKTATPGERDDFLTNVWVHEGPTALRGTFDGRAFVLDPPN